MKKKSFESASSTMTECAVTSSMPPFAWTCSS